MTRLTEMLAEAERDVASTVRDLEVEMERLRVRVASASHDLVRGSTYGAEFIADSSETIAALIVKLNERRRALSAIQYVAEEAS